MAFKFYAFKLAGIALLVFIMQIMFVGFTELLLLNQLAFAQPWRFVSAVFLHGGLAHLIYNIFALVLFGSILEKLVGGKRFLIIFFSAGILANLISINFYPSSLGASGAVFGIIGALIIIRPMQVVFAFGLPMPIFIAGVLWAIGDIIGIFIPDGIANIAHLSGMVFGILIGFLYKKPRKKKKNKRFEVNEMKIRRWEDNWM